MIWLNKKTGVSSQSNALSALNNLARSDVNKVGIGRTEGCLETLAGLLRSTVTEERGKVAAKP